MNSLTPYDAYQIMNQLVKQATGRTDLVATDTSSFITVGETVLRTGTENVLNALSVVLARTIFSTRPYRAKLNSVQVDQRRWGGQTRKVVYLMQDFEQSQDYNTQLSPNALANGNSVDMYKINAPDVVQLNFYGTAKLQKHITRFRDQLSMAFTSEYEFNEFVTGVLVEFNNEVELGNEGKTRATVLNFMAGISSMGLTEVDLTKEYNDRFGTSYTREQLLSTQMESFMKFMAGQIKVWSKQITDLSVMYHANLTGKKPIPRHTPQERQKMLMYEPIFIEAQSMVYSSLFNPRYLEIGDFEGVNYWQSKTTPTEINIKPNILDVATGSSKTAETAVNLPFVIGLLYDEEALGVMPQFDYASTTPFNSAGGYFNMFLHWRFNLYNDFTENAVLFVMGAGGPGDAPGEEKMLKQIADAVGTKAQGTGTILNNTLDIKNNTARIPDATSVSDAPTIDQYAYEAAMEDENAAKEALSQILSSKPQLTPLSLGDADSAVSTAKKGKKNGNTKTD